MSTDNAAVGGNKTPPPSNDPHDNQEEHQPPHKELTPEEYQAYHARVTNMYVHYVPEKSHKAKDIDGVMAKFKGREEALMMGLVRKFGPEPPLPGGNSSSPKTTDGSTNEKNSIGPSSAVDFRTRIERIMRRYAPEKLHNAAALADGFRGKEEECIQQLKIKYKFSQEPTAEEDAALQGAPTPAGGTGRSSGTPPPTVTTTTAERQQEHTKVNPPPAATPVTPSVLHPSSSANATPQTNPTPSAASIDTLPAVKLARMELDRSTDASLIVDKLVKLFPDPKSLASTIVALVNERSQAPPPPSAPMSSRSSAPNTASSLGGASYVAPCKDCVAARAVALRRIEEGRLQANEVPRPFRESGQDVAALFKVRCAAHADAPPATPPLHLKGPPTGFDPTPRRQQQAAARYPSPRLSHNTNNNLRQQQQVGSPAPHQPQHQGGYPSTQHIAGGYVAGMAPSVPGTHHNPQQHNIDATQLTLSSGQALSSSSPTRDETAVLLEAMRLKAENDALEAQLMGLGGQLSPHA